jgi:DNA-binding NarL/FixJ family response regulator
MEDMDSTSSVELERKDDQRGPPTDRLRTTDAPIRILIVEKLQLVADALEALLNQQPGMVVVGHICSLAESDQNVAELNPDVVILDFRLHDGLAADAARAIWQARSTAKVIFLTSDESDNVVLAAIDAGASAVLYLSTAASDVIAAIRTVADGRTLIPPSTIAKLLNNRKTNDGVRERLTCREKDILRLLAKGTSNREMAANLGISYFTVRSHVRNLSGKLAAHSKLEVIAKAQKLDLVERPDAATFAFA